MPTAAIVIIGNEILTGKFADENGPFLLGRLRALGCEVRRIVTIDDVVDDIADEVARCAGRFDHVLTTGGVGPTHDDLTFDGVAAAFGLGLELREEIAALLDAYGLPRTPANLRMATLPIGATLIVGGTRAPLPIVLVRNVFVLPGVPHLVRRKFDAIAGRFVGPLRTTARVYVTESETSIADRLYDVAGRHPAVAIGSYPRFEEGPYEVILTLESLDEAAVYRAADDLRASFLTGRVGDG
jgi:molybdenum cofactor synthesis domain-containing protein